MCLLEKSTKIDIKCALSADYSCPTFDQIKAIRTEIGGFRKFFLKFRIYICIIYFSCYLILYLKEQQTKKLQNLKSNTVVTVQKENNTFNFRISNILNILTSYINTYQTNSFYPIKTKNQKGKNKINNEITPSSFSFSLLNKKNKKNKNKN